MIEDLGTLLEGVQSFLLLGFAVFLRVGAFIGFVPAFGEQVIPMRVRFGIAAALTIVIAPAVVNIIEIPVTLSSLVLVGFAELSIGLFLGLLLRLFILALSTAGTIAAQSTSLSQIFGGSTGVEPQPAIGHVMIVSGLALATLAGLHVQLVFLLIHSYQIFPFGQIPGGSDLAQLGVGQISYLFKLAFAIAAPFLIASLLYNVTLGVINRAMPQLMVSFVGAPVITAGGLFILLASLPLGLSIWLEALQRFLADPLSQGF